MNAHLVSYPLGLYLHLILLVFTLSFPTARNLCARPRSVRGLSHICAPQLHPRLARAGVREGSG
jgi:hypothetical protein